MTKNTVYIKDSKLLALYWYICFRFGWSGAEIKCSTKIQLISKRAFLSLFNSSKKRTKNFCPSRPRQKFEVRFLEELKTPKRHFEIN